MERKGDSAAHPFCWSTPVLENTATSKREEEETETRGNCADGNEAAAERWRLERERVYTFEGEKKKMMLQRNWGTCSLPVPTDCLDGPLRGALLFPAHLFPHPKRLLLLLLKTPHFFAPFVWHITTLHYLRPWCWLNHLVGGNPAKRINIYFSLTSAVDGTHLNLPEIAIKH